MKVDNLHDLAQMVRVGAAPEARTSAATPPRAFGDALRIVHEDTAQKRLDVLARDIEAQGSVLGRRCDILELKRFREMVTEYLHEAVRFMYEFRKQNTFDGRGRHKMYAIIKKCNETMEAMTQAMLSEETDNLSLLAAIDEIRGMLIDILL